MNLFTSLSDRFSQQTFLLGETFTVADAAIGSALGFIPLIIKLDLSLHPGVEAYIQRISERPAYQKAMIQRRTS